MATIRPRPTTTIVNLRDAEDAAAKLGMPPGLGARFARSALGLETSEVTLFFEAGPDGRGARLRRRRAGDAEMIKDFWEP